MSGVASDRAARRALINGAAWTVAKFEPDTSTDEIRLDRITDIVADANSAPSSELDSYAMRIAAAALAWLDDIAERAANT